MLFFREGWVALQCFDHNWACLFCRILSERIRSRGVHQPPLILLDHDEDRDVVALKSRLRSSTSDSDVIDILDTYSPQPKSPEGKTPEPKKVNPNWPCQARIQEKSVFE